MQKNYLFRVLYLLFLLLLFNSQLSFAKKEKTENNQSTHQLQGMKVQALPTKDTRKKTVIQ